MAKEKPTETDNIPFYELPESNPPQPDKDIEELAEWLWERLETSALALWEDNKPYWREAAKNLIAKLRTLGWEKRGGEATEKDIEELRLTKDEIQDAYAAGETADFDSGWQAVCDAQILKVKLAGYRSPSEIRAIERDAVERAGKIIGRWLNEGVIEESPKHKQVKHIPREIIEALANWEFPKQLKHLESELLGEQDKGG
jgi:hypothetical protein